MAEQQSLNDINAAIQAQRAENTENSMGIRAALYKNLPIYQTTYDLMKDEVDTFEVEAMAVNVGGTWLACNTIAELVQLLKINIGATDLDELLTSNTLCGHQVLMSEQKWEETREYRKRFY